MKNNRALLISILLHGLLIAAMVVGFSFNETKMVFASTQVQPVKAVFIDAQAIADEKRQQQAQAQAQREQQLKQERIKQEQLKKEQQRKEQLAREKKAREEAERKKKAQERKREEAKKREEERQRLEKAAKEEAEFQRRVKEEREKQLQFEKELADQLKAEQQAIQAAQQQRVMSELQKYRSLIMQTIYQNLYIDDSAKNKECILSVKLAPDGLVIATTILEGDPALCQAARSAVLRPATLPVSSDPAVFDQMKTIKLTVKPQ
ncbi:MAG: cell envelope integrity protein TolA [Pseudomonadota bacterium]